MGGRNMKSVKRLFLCASLCTIIFAFPGYAQISSWIDENGVRHFSNVDIPGEHKTVKKMEEYQTDSSDEEMDRNRDRFQILRMYEEDRENEERKKSLEEEKREAEEKKRNQQEAAEKAAREKEKSCTESKIKLDDLRHSKWEDFDAPGLSLITCPDRHWKGAHGKVFDNMRECTERRDKALKNAYQHALRQHEQKVENFCENPLE
jgi:hypothetical protein